MASRTPSRLDKGKGRAVEFGGPVRESTAPSALDSSMATATQSMPHGGWDRQSAMSTASGAQPFHFDRDYYDRPESSAYATPAPTRIEASPARARADTHGSSDGGSPTRARASLGTIPRNFSRPMRLTVDTDPAPAPASELSYHSSSPPTRATQFSSSPPQPSVSASWHTPRATEPIREDAEWSAQRQPDSAIEPESRPSTSDKRDRHKSVSSIGTTKSDRSSRWRFFGRKGPRSVESVEDDPAPAPTITLSLDGHEPAPLGLGEADFERARAREDADRLAREQDERRRRAEAHQRLAAASSMGSPRLTTDAAMEKFGGPGSRSRSASASSKGSQLSRTGSVASDFSYYSLGGGHESGSEGHALSEGGHTPLPGPSGMGPPDRTLMKAKRSLDLLKAPLDKSAPRTPGGSHKPAPTTALSPNDPSDCLQLGIECHERGELARSAYFFERAAKERGGVGAGMLMWGLTLRHVRAALI